MSEYVELHKHSYWSLLDGVGSAEAGARRAAELGHPALAMTEHAVLSGVVHHMDACREVGIQPIVGVEAYYRPNRLDHNKETNWEYFHMLLLAKDVRGWRSLKLITSEAFRTGFYRKPCVDDDLFDRYSEGLMISTSCVSGYIPRAILRGDDAAVRSHCDNLTRWVGDDWYFEIQPHDFCLAGETMVAVADGRNAVAIQQLAAEGDSVDVYASEGGKTVIRKMNGIRMTRGNAPVVRVNLDDDTFVRCTLDHRFLLSDGITYKRADELCAGDSLMRFDSRLAKDSNGILRRKVWQGLTKTIVKDHDRAGKAVKGWTAFRESWEYQYRLVARHAYGDYAGGHIHHIDENVLNDAPDNLEILSGSEHSLKHWASRSASERTAWAKRRAAGLTQSQQSELGRRSWAKSDEENRAHAAKVAASRRANGTASGYKHNKKRSFKPITCSKCLTDFIPNNSKRKICMDCQPPRNHKVVSVVDDGFANVYCGAVDTAGNLSVVTTGSPDVVIGDLSGVVVHNCDLQIVNREAVSLGQSLGRPVVAKRDAHAPDDTWVETQHVSVMMRLKGSMVREARKEHEADEKYDLRIADTAYIASEDQTREDFRRHHPGLDARVVDEAISNTGWVASRCVPWLMDRTPKMPRYRDTVEESYNDLRRQVYAGLEQRGHADDQRYIDRVEMELTVYRDRQVCDFFLIVGDLVRWMKSPDGLPAIDYDPHPAPSKTPKKVGLGRGSAGGCCVAYALGITLINPINYELRFERFLNPHREGLPDIDLDFTPDGANLAKEYLKRRYGPDKVYDLISHGTMAARGALSRVAMVYEIPHAQRVALTKKIPEDESNVKLETLREHIPELDRFAEDHPRVFEHAVRMQGSIGAQSEHAAGVVISGQPLDELMPVMKKSAKDDYLVTAFGETADKPTISKLGFLKLDLLVVVELAKQAYAEELIRRVHGVDIDLDSMSWLEDPYAVDEAAMDIFRSGAVRGVFQWDGKSNMASLTKRLQPAHMHHLAGANAVVRPGVSVHAESYVARRHGEHFDYWDAAVEPALRETYGLPIFQEQIMSVFELLGGFSPAEADDVRRIMSKDYRSKEGKAQRNLALHRDRFVAAAAALCGQAMAGQIWDFCGHAAEYCFNRIHAEEYSCMAKSGAWLKAHYPDAFYASLLTFPPAWVKKPENRSEFYERIVREARSFGIDVRPPDVNLSIDGFTIEGDAVRFGLKGIKGLGPAMVADVLNNRPFASLEDMGAKLTACNAAGRHALAQAGALDRFNARANLTPDERAAHEEDRIGVALSGEDKLAPVRDGLRALIHTADEVEAAPNGQALVVGGEIVYGNETNTKMGIPGLKLTIAFGADEYKVSIPPWDYDETNSKGKQLRELIASDAPVVVRGYRDVEYDCVACDEIKAASEVLKIMNPEREQVAA